MRRSDLYFALLLTSSASLACLPTAAAIDARVRAAMAETCANGMAIAVIDDGRVAYVQAYGARNAKGDPLQTDTVMYGASLTKTVMAYTTLTLVDQGKLDLDAPLADYLDRPLISSPSSAWSAGDVACCFSLTMFGPRRASPIWCALYSAKPAFLTIGNMPVRRASPDRLLSSSQTRQNVSRSAN